MLIKVLGDSTNQPSADYQQSNPFHSGYGPHNPFSKDSGIQTTISSRTAKRTNADKSDGRDSDEIVLRGIEVHTEVNHGVTRHQTRDIRDDSSTNLSA